MAEHRQDLSRIEAGNARGRKCRIEAGYKRIGDMERDSVGFNGWVMEDMPEEEGPKRAVIDALEMEVIRWQNMW